VTNAPATFRQSDLQRALRAARKVSPELRVRITRAGEIVVERGEGEKPEPALDASGDFRL
jgi:hypothetical protein